MVKAPTIKGKFVTLRPVVEEDAEYILSLRTNPDLNTFLNPVDDDITKQRAWIAEHNRANNGYYFMMLDSQRQACGVIRMHDIKKETCVIGSWVVAPECGGFAVVEALALCLSQGFALGCHRCVGLMHEDNKSVLRVYSALGGKYVGKKEGFLEYEITKKSFEKTIKKYRWFNTSGLT